MQRPILVPRVYIILDRTHTHTHTYTHTHTHKHTHTHTDRQSFQAILGESPENLKKPLVYGKFYPPEFLTKKPAFRKNMMAQPSF